MLPKFCCHSSVSTESFSQSIGEGLGFSGEVSPTRVEVKLCNTVRIRVRVT
jgi:hypothetical protein